VASAPETEMTRRRFAGVGSGEGSRPPFRVRVAAMRSWRACAHDLGVGVTSQAATTGCRVRWRTVARRRAAATSEITLRALVWHAKRLYATLVVDGVFWYTKHVHYTLVWIGLWN
jgi:hypothetical protein